MKILRLLLVAVMPIIEILLVTAIGLVLALNSVNILNDNSRKSLNQLVYYVLNPALVGSNLAETITGDSLRKLWFMPVNVLLTNMLGTALGWALVKLTRVPKGQKGLIIGCCSAGNLGNLPIIIIPAICKQANGPFGASDTCHSYGMGYASLSMALGSIFCWSYALYIVRICSVETAKPSSTSSALQSSNTSPVSWPSRIKKSITITANKIHLKALMSPSTIAVILGFIIGIASPLRRLLIGEDAILHVIDDSIYMIGDAAVPAMTLILGASLLQGLKGSNVQMSVVIGITIVRYVLLPGFGVVIVRGAIRLGIIQMDPLFVFVLLLQHAMPPAMNISTICEMFGTAEIEGSVIMFWTYAAAPVALTLWSALFLWLVS